MKFFIQIILISVFAQISFADFQVDTNSGGRETFHVAIEPAKKTAILTWSLEGRSLAKRAIPLSLALELQRDLAVHFIKDTLESNNTLNCNSKMVIGFRNSGGSGRGKSSAICLSGLSGEPKRKAKESLRTIRQLASRKSL